jgi:nucleoside-diphosphate-sugar epimerase
MRIFVTGGTGQIGSQLVKQLVASGHIVIGLAHTSEGADKLKQWGAQSRTGDLTDVNSLVAGVQDADATIHLAFIHDFSRYAEAGDIDLAAVKAMVDASRNKVFVGTIGLLSLQVEDGQTGTEDDDVATNGPAGKRGEAEMYTRQAAAQGVKSAVIRLPVVHFDEDTGFVPSLVRLARNTGVSAYPNNGDKHWPAVHRDDAARLYQIVTEKLADSTLTPGLAWHAVAENGVASKDIAIAIADKLHLGEAISKPTEHFGWLGMMMSKDCLVTSEKTRKLTGWESMGPSLVETIHDPKFSTEATKTMLYM